MIKFMTGFGNEKITRVGVAKESESSVWLHDGARQLKKSTHAQYFDTWEEAHAYLIDRAERDVFNARFRLSNANEHLKRVRAITP